MMTKTVEELAPTTAKSCRELYVACCHKLQEHEQHSEAARMLGELRKFADHYLAESIDNWLWNDDDYCFEQYMAWFEGLPFAEKFEEDPELCEEMFGKVIGSGIPNLCKFDRLSAAEKLKQDPELCEELFGSDVGKH
jgi:hypothetical protein